MEESRSGTGRELISLCVRVVEREESCVSPFEEGSGMERELGRLVY